MVSFCDFSILSAFLFLMFSSLTVMCLDMDFFLFILRGIGWLSESEDWYLSSELENPQRFFYLGIRSSPLFLFTLELQLDLYFLTVCYIAQSFFHIFIPLSFSAAFYVSPDPSSNSLIIFHCFFLSTPLSSLI